MEHAQALSQTTRTERQLAHSIIDRGYGRLAAREDASVANFFPSDPGNLDRVAPTMSKATADRLQEVEAHFSQMTAGVLDYVIFLLDPSGIVRTWNAGAARIKGYSAQEMIGQPFTKFYSPEAIASGFPPLQNSPA